jgi:two-component system chemotaxis sensor kinase CheA
MVRKGKATLVKHHIDIFLEVCDTLQMLMEHVQNEHTEEDFSVDIDELIARLDRMVQDLEGGTPAQPVKENVPEEPSEQDQTEERFDNESLITPDMVRQFVVESREMLDELEQDLLVLEKEPDNLEVTHSAFRAMHSLKGNAGFSNYKDINLICHRAETFLDLVRNGSVKADSRQISTILQVLDFIRAAVDQLDKGKAPIIAGRVGLIDLMDEVFGSDGPDEKPEEEATPSERIPKSDAEPAHAAPEKTPAEESVKAGSTADTKPTRQVKTERKQTESKKSGNEVIRVDVDKLNKLMDLVGEIVIAESMVSQHPAIRYEELEGFEKSVSYLQKNVRELQELATSMRMIPLSGVFGKMRRLVRDISDRSKKPVELAVVGGDTEVDRSVIEHISDPLVHILRNAVDHGIEPADVRRQNNKPLTGNIHLEAKQVGGEIWILIRDDGGGLNREKILKKAIEKGLVSEMENELPDEKVWALIFQPGFSTASKVTDISGRGVGLDVVVRNLEKIRGRVDIRSTTGTGTTMTLKIPLTTAIVDGMLMRVEDSLYAIPTLDIKESLQVHSDRVVELMDGQELIKLRNSMVPVLRLQELHNIAMESKRLEDGIVVVTEKGGSMVGFLIDEIIGQQQLVVKALPRYSGNIRGVSGCAVLGNGEICLILDLANLVKLATAHNNMKETING